MPYIELNIEITPYNQQLSEILVANLAELGFDSFSETETGILAYIPNNLFNPHEVDKICKSFSINSTLCFTNKQIEDQNWNALWESNFEPITIDNLCRIRAPFHPSESGFRLELTIEPKMSFGTGHHQTTWLMVREMFEEDFTGKRVLDMGCGTGILAIVAEKLGASSIDAVDIDIWAVKNSAENITYNGCSKISVKQGDTSVIRGNMYDIILANINLNVLIADINTYSSCLTRNGILILSGILLNDIPAITEKALSAGFVQTGKKNRNDWVILKFLKT